MNLLDSAQPRKTTTFRVSSLWNTRNHYLNIESAIIKFLIQAMANKVDYIHKIEKNTGVTYFQS